MNQAWKKLNLDGGGLQSVNARLTQQMKRPKIAYLLCTGFPLGLHRFYLDEPIGGWIYVALSLLGAGLAIGISPGWVFLPIVLELAWLIYDLFWIDRRIVAYNKALRMQHFLRSGKSPPEGYRGRYSDESELNEYIQEKESERAGHQPVEQEAGDREGASRRRIPSFSEQEAMLRELSRRRRSGP